ncbi:hypothetical protein ACF1FX_25925 [Streptomyces sp. NPDC014646]|uniref:hypothetical protein n=1 Tax=Streptomyces sp. NPDC014646 TaxID=3364877 RepID=UPI00093F1467|nr:hypothetical protein [Streptomyces sp. CB01580]OKJ27736.1 hypothetical protein AMK22_30185 [Streptomyces sp. CB01580]
MSRRRPAHSILLAIVVVLRLRRRTEARSRLDEKFTVIIVLALGVLIAPTPVGQGILDFLSW